MRTSAPRFHIVLRTCSLCCYTIIPIFSESGVSTLRGPKLIRFYNCLYTAVQAVGFNMFWVFKDFLILKSENSNVQVLGL